MGNNDYAQTVAPAGLTKAVGLAAKHFIHNRARDGTGETCVTVQLGRADGESNRM